MNLERVRYIASNYHHLQGLKQVPVGILLLLVAVSNSVVRSWYTMWKPIPDLFVWLLVFVAYALISVYYRKSFGQVERSPWSKRGASKVVILFLAITVAFAVDMAFWPPVSIIGSVCAIWMFSIWWDGGRMRAQYVVAAGALAGASLWPLVGAVTPKQFFSIGLPISLGAVFLVNGIIDHLVLKRLLPPAPEEGPNAVR